MIALRSAMIEVDVDEGRGAQITRVAAPGGPNVLGWYEWDSPLPPTAESSYGDSELDWLGGYRGGWQETFPNSGQACEVDGLPIAFHGEASTARWTVQEADDEHCVLTVGSRLPLRLTRTMTLDPDRACVRVESRVENVGAVVADFVWGHHPAFPALAGARIELPRGARVRPDADRTDGLRVEPSAWPTGELMDGSTVDLSTLPDSAVHRLLYVDELADGWAALRQPRPGMSVGLAWDTSAYPYSWLWIMREDPAFPWFGRASLVGIECQTAWPYDGLAAARNRGMAHRVLPGEGRSSWLTVRLLPDDPRAIDGVDRDGDVEWAVS